MNRNMFLIMDILRRRLPFVLPLLLAPCIAWAQPRVIEGPVQAELVRVIDGDTFEADAFVWPGHRIRVSVRLRGIDAPELRSRCDEEVRAAMKARDALEAMLDAGPILISRIGGDKYFGRVIADVGTPQTVSLAASLLEKGHAVPYDGGRRNRRC